jgi:hypothetical protein
MDNLIELEQKASISVVSRIIFKVKKITAYYEKSHTIEKKEPNGTKMPIPGCIYYDLENRVFRRFCRSKD